MADIRPLGEGFAVAPQIRPEDLPDLKAAGVVLVVNNRPDGEEAGQPFGHDIEAAADALGLAYRYIPVRGMPSAGQAEAVLAAADEAGGRTLAFCRTGTRCAVAWAIGQTARGVLTPEGAIRAAAEAGYDLSGAAPALAAVSPGRS